MEKYPGTVIFFKNIRGEYSGILKDVQKHVGTFKNIRRIFEETQESLNIFDEYVGILQNVQFLFWKYPKMFEEYYKKFNNFQEYLKNIRKS